MLSCISYYFKLKKQEKEEVFQEVLSVWHDSEPHCSVFAVTDRWHRAACQPWRALYLATCAIWPLVRSKDYCTVQLFNCTERKAKAWCVFISNYQGSQRTKLRKLQFLHTQLVECGQPCHFFFLSYSVFALGHYPTCCRSVHSSEWCKESFQCSGSIAWRKLKILLSFFFFF